MNRIRHSILAVIVAALFVQGARAQVGNSPVGTWEVAYKDSAKDKGTIYLTFAADQTLSGYGITLQSFSLFFVSGTWSLDAYEQVAASIVVSNELTFGSGTLLGKAKTGSSFKAKGTLEGTPFNLKGIPVSGYADVSGTWHGQFKISGMTADLDFVATPSEDYIGIWDLDGSVSGPGGSVPFVGAVLVAGGKRVFGYVGDPMDPFSRSSLSGKLGSYGQTLKGSIQDPDGFKVGFQATRY